ncbi:hypothetical protein [Microvirga makkahensis]|uniref:Uncharacterized protein n=1 Tax=Microvirga makkahensis TaxID=1128670 RepID=A0A7X3MVV4_9HYPH|nr:hypothetical protein [Microvirga makkahensis]MXQ14124.1 hypothetical protein [Microvirga makkahensis]
MNRNAALLLQSLAFFDQVVSGSGIAPERARQMAQGAAAEVLDALARRDFGKLATFVSEEGLAVSPYVMLHDGTVRLSRSEIERCASDPQARHWGEMDGTGDPIEITCGRYFDEFVWTADYRQADEVLYNEPRRRGNDINNNHEFAPDGIVVEFHIRGKSSLLELDWKSLRLIFRRGEQGLSLLAITRDVWTI